MSPVRTETLASEDGLRQCNSTVVMAAKAPPLLPINELLYGSIGMKATTTEGKAPGWARMVPACLWLRKRGPKPA